MARRKKKHLRRQLPPAERVRAGEDALFRRFLASGSTRDYERIVRRFSNLVHRVAHDVLQNIHDAQDAVQSTFMLLWEKRRDLRPENLRAWLAQTATYEAMSLSRRKHAAASLDGDDEPVDHLGAADIADEEERTVRLQRIWQAVPQMSPIDQQVFRGRHELHLEFEDLAKECGVTVPVVRQRLCRAEQRLRKLLGELFPNDPPRLM